MRVAVVGASGLIGGAVARALTARGDGVVAVSRGGATGLPGVEEVRWDPAEGPPPPDAVRVDAVVNLAGAPIAGKRWTARRKRLIRESRVLTTRLLADALAAEGTARVLVNGSAVGYYGPTGDREVDEAAAPGQDFLADTAVAWEREALRAAAHGVRVVLVRTGIVLSADGGALPPMALPVRFYAGGPVGGGRQWVPWIHIDDEVGIILHALGDDGLSGPVNATAPEPVRQRELVTALAETLRRPAVVPAPAVAVRLALGEMSTLILDGQRALPAVALARGYAFAHDEVDEALFDIYR
ncbi:MAG: TIGR01777 family oxidoreductase [Thermoleophilia bacterium]